MMMLDKVFNWLAVAVVCSLLLATGCAPPPEEIAKPEVEPEKRIPKAPAPQTGTFALKFTPRDSTAYRVTTEARQSLKFEGSLSKDAKFTNKNNRNRVEMTFTQQVQSVDDKGNAVAKITIESLKYLSVYKNNLMLDFDSSEEEDKDNPLAKLIGKSYTIKIAPTGEVTEVIDVKAVQAVAKGSGPADKAALKLFSPDIIKKLHGTLTLPNTDENQLRTGDSWSSMKVFSFGMMGSKPYEKIYMVKEIKDYDNRQIAALEMSAIPTSKMAQQLHEQQTTDFFSGMFDNVETYTGQLKLDLTAGKVERYFEKLQSEWIAIDPEAKQSKDPDTLRMKATRIYSLEKID